MQDGSSAARIIVLVSVDRLKRSVSMISYSSLLTEVRGCTVRAPHLPLGPRPVLQLPPS